MSSPKISLGGDYVAFYMDTWRYQNFQGRGNYTSSSAEIHLSVDGTSVEYKINQDSMYQASVNVDIVLQKITSNDSIDVMKSNFNYLVWHWSTQRYDQEGRHIYGSKKRPQCLKAGGICLPLK